MEVIVTHTLNAHFVEIAAPSTVEFDQSGVSVRVATTIKTDGTFATITCAGTTDMAEDGQLTDAAGPLYAMSASIIMLTEANDRQYTPAIAAACHRIENVLKRVGSVLRWRFGVHGPDAVFKDTAVSARLADGRALDLYLVPQAAMGDDQAKIAQDGLEAVTSLLASSQCEPVAHELWREAWNLRLSSPRSSLVVGVAAAEVGLKQLIATLVPDAKSLVENVPSPPLDVMIRKVLPTIPIRAAVEPTLRTPRHLRTVIAAAVEDRNRVVHRGAMPGGDLRAILLVIREFLYLLDIYAGQAWAETLLTETTRTALMTPQKPATAD
jgi:hypothetical protein